MQAHGTGAWVCGIRPKREKFDSEQELQIVESSGMLKYLKVMYIDFIVRFRLPMIML